MWPVPNLRAYLAGGWKIDRLVVDRVRQTTGWLQGQATFTPSPGRLVYEERGILSLGEHRGTAEQSYLYDFPACNAQASVRFRDGRAFHDLDLSEGHDRVRHSCPPDLYEGLFVALGPITWRSKWTVAGPRKDYDLVTTYTRRVDDGD